MHADLDKHAFAGLYQQHLCPLPADLKCREQYRVRGPPLREG